MNKVIKKELADYLTEVDYETFIDGYKPSTPVVEFFKFMQLVNANAPLDNKTPKVHLKAMEKFFTPEDTINLMHRGFGKTTLLKYFIIYVAFKGGIDGAFDRKLNTPFAKMDYCIYVSDTERNGVNKMFSNIKTLCGRSSFLQQVFTLDKCKFNLSEIVLTRRDDGGEFYIDGFGVGQNVRGTNRDIFRPNLVVLDDLISNANAKSETVIEDIKATVDDAVLPSMDPNRSKVIWNGTPFNSADPITSAIEGGAYDVNVYPVCDYYPCEEHEFVSAWPDRFDYHAVAKAYRRAPVSFQKEYMLRFMSDADRAIPDHHITYHNVQHVLDNRQNYNWYITTDYATTNNPKDKNCLSCMNVWALDYHGNALQVDTILKKNNLMQNRDDLFRLVQEYDPTWVSIETNGQQNLIIDAFTDHMNTTGIYFNIQPFHSKGEKHNRFVTSAVPYFSSLKIKLPDTIKGTTLEAEVLAELRGVANDKFTCVYKDYLDTVSQFCVMMRKNRATKPYAPENGNCMMQEDYYEYSDNVTNVMV